MTAKREQMFDTLQLVGQERQTKVRRTKCGRDARAPNLILAERDFAGTAILLLDIATNLQ